MHRLSFALIIVGFLPVAARAAPLRVDITYIDGHIVSGPLTPDLDELPSSVFASFTLAGPGGTLADVIESSLVFGDGAWSADDLESFSASFLPTDAGGLAVTSLTYSYRAIDTPTTNGKLAANFPLEIMGIDVASGLPFLYQYDTSSQTVTEIPEPSSVVLAALGLGFFLPRALRRTKRGVKQCA
ncbi:MAG: PEP-CTERM sorting domain-containing protein [Pirellulales bacterium]